MFSFKWRFCAIKGLIWFCISVCIIALCPFFSNLQCLPIVQEKVVNVRAEPVHSCSSLYISISRAFVFVFVFENTFPFRGLVLVSANHRLGTSGVRFELGKWSMLVVLNLTFLNHYWFRQPSTDQWRARSCLPFKQNMHNQREAWCLVKRFSCKTWKDRAINLGSFNILTQNRVLANQNRVR